MTEEKKSIKKNPNPLVVKGVFFVTAVFEDKRYVVSNGLSFIQFAKEGEDIKKGDYLSIHGPVYQRKDAANPIITGEAVVKKLSEEEVEFLIKWELKLQRIEQIFKGVVDLTELAELVREDDTYE